MTTLVVILGVGERIVKRVPLGEQEQEVLGYAAERAPITVGEVARHFGESRGLARTTISTVMERLRGKGDLRRRKVKGVYQYSPSMPKGDLLRSLVRDFADRVFGGSAQPFVAYLIQDARLSDSEVAKLEELVRELARKRKGAR